MVRKLHSVIIQQDSYQKAVPLVAVALMFKSVHALDSGVGGIAMSEAEEVLAQTDTVRTVERICRELRAGLHKRYVGKGKTISEMFEKYMLARNDILIGFSTDASQDRLPLFEHLRKRLPDLTEKMYKEQHQTTLEYFVKLGKDRLKDDLRR